MLKFKHEANWGSEVSGLKKKYNLSLKNENINNTSVRGWKLFVKSSVYREAFLQLQVDLSINRKTSHLSCSKLFRTDYLKELLPSFARVVFRTKIRTLDIKINYENKYPQNLKCPFCCVLDETFHQIFTCRFGTRVPKEIKHFRLQSFGSEVAMPVLEKLGRLLKNTVHI